MPRKLNIIDIQQMQTNYAYIHIITVGDRNNYIQFIQSVNSTSNDWNFSATE